MANTLKEFILGLNILSKYMKDGLDTKYFAVSEHDCIYYDLGENVNKLTNADKENLKNYGFKQNLDSNWVYES